MPKKETKFLKQPFFQYLFALLNKRKYAYNSLQCMASDLTLPDMLSV